MSNQLAAQRKKRNIGSRKRSAPLPTLPEDALSEIIARLPPKPFFRFKCVAKSWLALSSNAFSQNRFLQKPDFYGLFINNLVQKTNKDVNFRILSGNKKEVDVKLNPLQNLGQITIKDCFNGLVLICALEPDLDCPLGAWRLFVYNPAIRRLVELPAPKRGPYIYDQFSLAYDPEISPEFHVIWFKAVQKPDRTWHTAPEIFSSTKGRWEQGKEFAGMATFRPWTSGVFLSGMVHYLINGRLVSVNPIEGVYDLNELPCQHTWYNFSNLTKSQGFLHYLVVKSDNLLIWVCVDLGKREWILKHEISLQETFGLTSIDFEFYNKTAPKVIALHPEKDVIFISVGSRKLLSYDLSTGTQNIACTLPRRGNLCFWNYVPCYSDFVFANE